MKQRHTEKFVFQFISACVIIGIAVFFVGREFWLCTDCYILGGYDAVPIFTKTKYIVECLHQGQIPAWFPYWYCGSAVYQYYPPLIYVITSAIEFFADNTNLTLKIYMIAGYSLGGLGVWAICRKYLNHWIGLFAAVFYIMCPYFTISFFYWGQIAQIPIIALAPWYFGSCISFYNNAQRNSWLAVVVLTLLLCTSHVMHGFMIVLSVFVSMLISTFFDKRSISQFCLWILGTALGVGLLSFWWLVGVFPLELNNVPSLEPSLNKALTASFSWFIPDWSDWFENISPGLGSNPVGAYFSLIVVLLSVLSIVLIQKEEGEKKSILRLLYINTIFTLIFSFGYHIPLFSLIPFSSRLVPGRILTQTTLVSSILVAYVVVKMMKHIQKGTQLKNFIVVSSVFLVLFSILNDYKDYISSYRITECNPGVYSAASNGVHLFDKGRISTMQDFHSFDAYYSYIYNLNNVFGWNLEGSVLNDYIKFQGAALKYEDYGYLLKSMNDMNVQYILMDVSHDKGFGEYLAKNSFLKISEMDEVSLYFREENSYFYEQKRDCIVIGENSEAFLSDFPWFVNGSDKPLLEYSVNDLQAYQTVYFYQPETNLQSEQKHFERLIESLVEQGKDVYVELGRHELQNAEVFGIYTTLVSLSGKQFLRNEVEGTDEYYHTNPYQERLYTLQGIDEVFFSLQSGQTKASDVLIGKKEVGSAYVTFIGGPITDQKSLVKGYYGGEDLSSEEYVKKDEVINSAFEYLFLNTDQYTELDLPAFPVKDAKWGIDEFEFSYESEADKRIMISVTYTPRWHAYIGEKELTLEATDKMLSLVVPAGEHTVHMKYIPTGYAKVGVYMSYFSAGMILLMLLYFKRVSEFFAARIRKSANWLELPVRHDLINKS